MQGRNEPVPAGSGRDKGLAAMRARLAAPSIYPRNPREAAIRLFASDLATATRCQPACPARGAAPAGFSEG